MWEAIVGAKFFDEAEVGGNGWCHTKVMVRESEIVAEASFGKFLECNESDKLSIKVDSKTLNLVKTVASNPLTASLVECAK